MNERPDQTIRLLLIEDNPDDALLLKNSLGELAEEQSMLPQVELVHVERLREGLELLSDEAFDLVLLDLSLPDSEGLGSVSSVCSRAPEIPVVVLTGLTDLTMARDALAAGAQDYLVKGEVPGDLLARAILYSLERNRLRLKLMKFDELAASEERLRRIITRSIEGIVIVDKAGMVLFVNPAAESIFSRSAPEMVGQSFGYPVDEDREIQLNIVAGDGELRAVDMRTTGITWEDAACLLVSLRDITGYKQAQERIIKQSELLEGINTVLLETITCTTDVAVAQRCLAVAEKLTGSAFGLIGEVDTDGMFDVIALSDPGWSSAPKKGSNAAIMVRMVRDIMLRGAYNSVLDDGQSLLVNRVSDSRRQEDENTLAPGITSFLAIPLKDEKRNFGMMVLANKEAAYDTMDLQAVEALSIAFVEALYRKRYEAALQESEERYQLVSRATNEVIWDWNVGTDSVRWNEAVTVLFGYRPGEVENTIQWWRDRIHPDDRERIVSGIDWSLDSGKTVWIDEYRFRRPNGSFSFILDRGFIQYDAEGHPVRMIGSMLDMTELKMAEERLRQSQDRYRQLFEYSPISLWEQDFSPVKKQLDELCSADLESCFEETPELVRELAGMVRIIDINTTTLEMFKALNKDRFVENPIQVFGEETYPMFARMLAALWEGETRFADDAVTWTLTGDKKHVSLDLHVAPGHEDTWSRVLVSIMDITDRVRSREALNKLVEELGRSNRELEDFAYIASHDLQEPLRKVMVFGDRILSRYATGLDEKGQDYFNRMMKASERMKHLILSLLKYSRVTTRKRTVEPVDLNEVIGDVLSDLVLQIEESDAVVEVDDLPPVSAARVHMYELFQNLISNGITFKAPGDVPQVIIESSLTGDGFVKVSVRDNGIGFKMEKLQRILKPFGRLHHRDDYPGVGIGLSICNKIAQRYEGELGIESSPGSGSVFTVTLPLAKQDVLETPPREKPDEIALDSDS